MDILQPVGIVVLLVIVFGVLGTIYSNWKFKKNSTLRWQQGYQEKDFFEPLEAAGVSREILQQALSHTRKWVGIQDFAVLPEDEICKFYGCCEEDFENFGVELAKLCNKQLPDKYPEGEPPVETISDLVIYIAKASDIPQK